MEKATVEIRRGSLKTSATIGEEKLKKLLDLLATGTEKEFAKVPVIKRRKRRQFRYKGKPLNTDLVKTFLANKIKVTNMGKMRSCDIITQMGMPLCGGSYRAIRQAAKELGFPIGREGKHQFIYFRRDALPSFSSPVSNPGKRSYNPTGIPPPSEIGWKKYHILYHQKMKKMER